MFLFSKSAEVYSSALFYVSFLSAFLKKSQKNAVFFEKKALFLEKKCNFFALFFCIRCTATVSEPKKI